MRRYETIAIIDPDLSEDDRSSLLTRIKDIIAEQDGFMIAEDLWGTKKLAYEIKKKPRGYYTRYDYCGMGPLVDELERSFRIDDRVMKYLTVQLDPDADVEQLKADIAAAQAAKEAEAATVQTTPAETVSSTAESSQTTPAETESSAAESSASESTETPVEAEQAPVPEPNDTTEKAEEEQS